MSNYWISIREFGVNNLKFFIKLIVLLFVFTARFAYADSVPVESKLITSTELSQQDMESYIESKIYGKVIIDDSYGQLLSESLIVNYTPIWSTKFYKDKICSGLYWFNCDYNLKGVLEYTGVDLSNESSLFSPSIESISGYKVSYTTIDMSNKSHNVSGGILIPNSNQPLKGVVLFYHYTVLNNQNVPSRFNTDETRLSRTLASSIASDGYAVIMPDYIGQGDDESSVHPYIIYPQVNAISGIYMLKLLAQVRPNISYMKINQKVPFFISGYSEGASYALWAAKILQDNPSYLNNYGFNLSKTVPISGAYNLSNVTLKFLLDKSSLVAESAPYFIQDPRVANFMRPALVGDVLSSYAHYTLHTSESDVFSSKFSECQSCEIKSKSYSISGLLQAPASEITKYKLFYNAAKKTDYGNDDYSVLPLANHDVLNSNEFKKQLIDADIYNWKSTTPIDFLTLENDSVVSRLNSEVAYTAMARQGSSSLNITIIPNQNFKSDGYIPFTDIDIDHGSAIPFMFLLARKSFNESSPYGKNN